MRQDNTIWLEIPADLRYLNMLDASLKAILERMEGVEEPEKIAYPLGLALQEACSNIVRHAYANSNGGRVEITFTCENAPPRLVIDLRDTGEAFNPNDIPPPALDDAQIHGYGLHLIKQLMDEVEYQPQPHNNRLRLIKNL